MTYVPDPFYPVLPNFDWLKRLVPLGVRLVQLRLKDAEETEIRRQIAASIELCDKHGCELYVNDYWREAIELGATAVHLGQEDLASADRTAIATAGLRLGLSSHDRAEREAAIAAEPDYVALGPIYETTLKKMRWRPQGLERIATWRSASDLPLVAIGGITLERADGVVEAGAHSIAVVTDIVRARQAEARVEEWLTWAEGVRARRRD